MNVVRILQNKKFQKIARIGVAVLLLWILFLKISVREVLHLLFSLHPLYFSLAIGLNIVIVILCTYRWQLLLIAREMKIPFTTALSYYFIGIFFNNFLPTTVGGDIIRATYTARALEKKKADALASVLVERVVAVGAMVAVAIVGMIIIYSKIKNPLFLSIIILVTALFIILYFIILDRRVFEKVKHPVNRIKFFNLGSKLVSLYESMTLFKTYKRATLYLFLLSLLVQICFPLVCFALAHSLGFHVPIVYFFVYIPIISIVSMAPISINAVGLREASFVLLFTSIGVLKEQALGLSLLFYITTILVSLMGGILFLVGHHKKEEIPVEIREEL